MIVERKKQHIHSLEKQLYVLGEDFLSSSEADVLKIY